MYQTTSQWELFEIIFSIGSYQITPSWDLFELQFSSSTRIRPVHMGSVWNYIFIGYLHLTSLLLDLFEIYIFVGYMYQILPIWDLRREISFKWHFQVSVSDFILGSVSNDISIEYLYQTSSFWDQFQQLFSPSSCMRLHHFGISFKWYFHRVVGSDRFILGSVSNDILIKYW